MLRLLTAGESHGPQITAILDGMPSGVSVDAQTLAAGMLRRQAGFGRGARQKIENDRVVVASGLRGGKTTGAPLTLVIPNRDHENWRAVLDPFQSPEDPSERRITRPRPGHADLVGMLKYGHQDARDVLERASARETVARVAAGEILRAFLRELGIEVFSHVRSIGGEEADLTGVELLSIPLRAEENDLRCAASYDAMRAAIVEAGREGDTLGGVFEVVVTGLPCGLGSSMAPDRKLDAQLAAAMLSIPAVKGVEIGPAFENAALPGSQVHDEIVPREAEPPGRASNRAGGLEGGMTTGEPLLVRGAMKPISTLRKPLRSVDLSTNRPQEAAFERSDVCAVPAAGVVGEAVVMMVLANATLESFGGDTLDRIQRGLRAYQEELRLRIRRVEGDAES